MIIIIIIIDSREKMLFVIKCTWRGGWAFVRNRKGEAAQWLPLEISYIIMHIN